jgi:hypothetical protein
MKSTVLVVEVPVNLELVVLVVMLLLVLVDQVPIFQMQDLVGTPHIMEVEEVVVPQEAMVAMVSRVLLRYGILDLITSECAAMVLLTMSVPTSNELRESSAFTKPILAQIPIIHLKFDIFCVSKKQISKQNESYFVARFLARSAKDRI